MHPYFEAFLQLQNEIGFPRALALNLAHEAAKRVPSAANTLRRRIISAKPRSCCVPIHLRLGTSDRDVLQQILIHEEYKPITGLYNIRTIVDCGANIGLTSVYLLDRYPQATLLAIEPDPDNAQMCRRNLAPFGTRASVEQLAVWTSGTFNAPTSLALDRTYGDRRDWAVKVRATRRGERPIAFGVSMDAICDRLGQIDLLKMDIEGAEALLFSSGYDSWLRHVQNLAVELHSEEIREGFHRLFDTQYRGDLSEANLTTFAMNIVEAEKHAE